MIIILLVLLNLAVFGVTWWYDYRHGMRTEHVFAWLLAQGSSLCALLAAIVNQLGLSIIS